MKTKERKDFQFEINNFSTLNTRDNPITMKDGELPILINFMPIGTSAYTIPSYSIAHASAVVPASTIVRMFSVNISGSTYLLVLTADGALYRFDPSNAWARLLIAPIGTFTVNARFEQWKNEGALIADANGYFAYFGHAAAVTNASSYAGVLVQSVGTPAKLKSVGTISYIIGATAYTKAAADPIVATGAFTCSNNFLNRAYLYLDTAGNWTIVQGAEQALGTLVGGIYDGWAKVQMLARDYTKSLIGILNMQNASGAGWTYGTDSLTKAGIFFNVINFQTTANMAFLGSNFNFTTLLTAAGEYVISSGNYTATAIANWKTRAWLVTGNNRSLTYSAPLNPFDFRTASTSGVVVDTIGSLKMGIVNLVPTGEYLYLVGDHATHTISGLQVLDTGTVIFQLSDAAPGYGAMWADTTFPLASSALMMSDVGIRAVTGTEAQELSSLLDGLLVTLDTTTAPAFTPVACFAKILNKLCYVVLFRTRSIVDGSLIKYLACLYEGKWFLVDYNTPTIGFFTICQSPSSSDTVTYGASSDSIYKLFSGYTVSLNHRIRTRASNFGTPLVDKQALRVGVLIGSTVGFTAAISPIITVSGDVSSAKATCIVNPPSVVWVNSLGNPVAWTDIFWTSPIPDAAGYSQVDGRGKRLQFDYDETSANDYILTGILVEGQYGAEW